MSTMKVEPEAPPEPPPEMDVPAANFSAKASNTGSKRKGHTNWLNTVVENLKKQQGCEKWCYC